MKKIIYSLQLNANSFALVYILYEQILISDIFHYKLILTVWNIISDLTSTSYLVLSISYK